MTLVLDLDHTLVCAKTKFFNYCDTKFWFISKRGHEISYYLSIRPHLTEFLKDMNELFEIVIFTASESEYATEILKIIDHNQKYIDFALFRDSWTFIDSEYIKDISLLGRPIEKTIIVDDRISSFWI